MLKEGGSGPSSGQGRERKASSKSSDGEQQAGIEDVSNL